jgi:hypothetical protein
LKISKKRKINGKRRGIGSGIGTGRVDKLDTPFSRYLWLPKIKEKNLSFQTFLQFLFNFTFKMFSR